MKWSQDWLICIAWTESKVSFVARAGLISFSVRTLCVLVQRKRAMNGYHSLCWKIFSTRYGQVYLYSHIMLICKGLFIIRVSFHAVLTSTAIGVWLIYGYHCRKMTEAMKVAENEKKFVSAPLSASRGRIHQAVGIARDTVMESYPLPAVSSRQDSYSWKESR